MQERIENKLTDFFNPSYLEVVNESHKHKGHIGDDGSGNSHFLISISSEKLNGLTRLEGQRLIYEILDDEMRLIHALSIKIKNI